jgi:hypothetical protein
MTGINCGCCRLGRKRFGARLLPSRATNHLRGRRRLGQLCDEHILLEVVAFWYKDLVLGGSLDIPLDILKLNAVNRPSVGRLKFVLLIALICGDIGF